MPSLRTTRPTTCITVGCCAIRQGCSHAKTSAAAIPADDPRCPSEGAPLRARLGDPKPLGAQGPLEISLALTDPVEAIPRTSTPLQWGR